MGVGLEFRLHGFLQADGLGGDDVHQGAALGAGEDGGVELFGPFLLGQDQTAAGAAERLMRRRRDDVGIGNGAHMRTAGDEAGDMGHIDHQQRAVAVGDLAEDLEVDRSGVRRRTGDDQLRAILLDQLLDLVIVDAAGGGVDTVGDEVVELARRVNRGTVGQVPAVGQAHADDGVTRL